MDMLDPGLDSGSASAAPSHEKSQETEESVELQEGEAAPGEEPGAGAGGSVAAPFGDPPVQYQFRTESNGGQVTYRVVQVTEAAARGPGEAAGAVGVVSAFAGAQQAVAQAVLQTPFSNGGSPGAEPGAEPRFAYFPAGGVAEGAVSVQGDPALAPAGGQFYVMMTPPEVLQPGPQRSIAPRTHPYSPKLDGTRTPRDERRRAQHNEGERACAHACAGRAPACACTPLRSRAHACAHVSGPDSAPIRPRFLPVLARFGLVLPRSPSCPFLAPIRPRFLPVLACFGLVLAPFPVLPFLAPIRPRFLPVLACFGLVLAPFLVLPLFAPIWP
ncbi:LOW QUALITY PROTEIN: upstream stimulatory factor 2-like, partial [Rhea pennata]|uniref:LOW QUALITY PROTEIN: upstream stimulatory factor 2-like n=1 Tax=Rhea pennata TaxID=8795 RepID=UPI002E267F8D